MKPQIQMWDDQLTMDRHYAVTLPALWFVRQYSRIGLTWLMVKLIWGIGAKRLSAKEGR